MLTFRIPETPEEGAGRACNPRLTGLWLAPRNLLSGLAATGPPLGGYRIGREGVWAASSWAWFAASEGAASFIMARNRSSMARARSGYPLALQQTPTHPGLPARCGTLTEKGIPVSHDNWEIFRRLACWAAGMEATFR